MLRHFRKCAKCPNVQPSRHPCSAHGRTFGTFGTRDTCPFRRNDSDSQITVTYGSSHFAEKDRCPNVQQCPSVCGGPESTQPCAPGGPSPIYNSFQLLNDRLIGRGIGPNGRASTGYNPFNRLKCAALLRTRKDIWTQTSLWAK